MPKRKQPPKHGKPKTEKVRFNQYMEITIPCIITGVGAPGFGKSSFNRATMFNIGKHFKRGWVICGSASSHVDYSYVDPDRIYRKYSPNLITMIMEEQEENWGEQAFLILDDVTGVVNFQSSQLKTLITMYRHYHLTLIIGFQFLRVNVPKLVLESTTFAFIFAQQSDDAVDSCVKGFAGGFAGAKDDFIGIIRRLPKYAFLFVDMTRKLPKAEEVQEETEEMYMTRGEIKKKRRTQGLTTGVLPNQYYIARFPSPDQIPEFELKLGGENKRSEVFGLDWQSD